MGDGSGRRPARLALLASVVLLAARADAAPATPGPPAGQGAAAATDDDRPVSSQATVARARFLMGARLAIEATGPDAVAAIEAAFGEAERLDKVLSNWRSDSEVSALNREAAEHPVTCGPDLCAVVGAALRWAQASGGAFDPTVEPLVRRLGLRGVEGRLPGVKDEADRVSPAAGTTTPATTADRW